jgi:large subunit ribosomal protein L21
MYAVIRTGGKQYTVRPGDVLRVEKLAQELGSEFDLNEVLLLGGEKTLIGEPTVANATVTVVVTQQARAPKVIVFKKKRRQGYRRLAGHRQLFTELFIKAITSPTGEVAKAETKPLVIDPAAKLERQKKYADANKEKAKTPKAAAKKAAAPAAKKKPAKKSAGKSGKGAAKKKTGAKKKASKK